MSTPIIKDAKGSCHINEIVTLFSAFASSDTQELTKRLLSGRPDLLWDRSLPGSYHSVNLSWCDTLACCRTVKRPKYSVVILFWPNVVLMD